jgi:ubiquitin C-terminal hydrolase
MNAVIQGLLSLNYFCDSLKEKSLLESADDNYLSSLTSNEANVRDPTPKLYASLIKILFNQERNRATDPTPLRQALKDNSDFFNNNNQQDAHEFLVQFLMFLQVYI